mmetsp:Transcript_133367/g.371818  ORF Transcript_133367/g.371818 Transcript_133367/m.371818 type:complete len:216 (-) Transcript_133367:114-761(-)
MSASIAATFAPALISSSMMGRSALRSVARSRAEAAEAGLGEPDSSACRGLPGKSSSEMSTCACAFSSMRKPSLFPDPAQRLKGVSMRSQDMLVLACASRSTRNTALCPPRTARCTAVKGCSPRMKALGSALCSSSKRAKPANPFVAAKWSGARPRSSRTPLGSALAMTRPCALIMSCLRIASIRGLPVIWAQALSGFQSVKRLPGPHRRRRPLKW